MSKNRILFWRFIRMVLFGWWAIPSYWSSFYIIILSFNNGDFRKTTEEVIGATNYIWNGEYKNET